MSGGVRRFLNRLPVEAPPAEALASVAAVARHVAGALKSGEPTSFSGVRDEPPAAVVSALGELEAQDCAPDVVGLAWEQLMASATRRKQGAHFTPRSVADSVVRLALGDLDSAGGQPRSVWDPAAGGGAFLLAAARAIETRWKWSRDQIVREIYATDIDPVALAVCDASLEMWCSGQARPHVANADALLDLPDGWPDDFSLVVGNPPFLGQLTSDTARDEEAHAELADRYGDVAGGYADQSSLFVELGLRHLGDTSVLALVLPQSFLAARDSEPVRLSVQNAGSLSSLWIDDAGSFEASVDVLAIVVTALPSNRRPNQDSAVQTKVVVGSSKALDVATPDPTSWSSLLARSQGVPKSLNRSSTALLGDYAHITAGFRQHFYGIQGAVSEACGPELALASGDDRTARLVTSGSIDTLAMKWGRQPVRFGGQRWTAPLLHLDSIADEDVRAWFEARMVPKVLVASQTPIIEAVVDTDGRFVPSVPVITIEPHDPESVWHLAAAVSAPATCAFAVEQAAGSGLSASAIRVSAKLLSAMPLPTKGDDWDSGAAAASQAQEAFSNGDDDAYKSALHWLGHAMTAAYQAPAATMQWWCERLG